MNIKNLESYKYNLGALFIDLMQSIKMDWGDPKSYLRKYATCFCRCAYDAHIGGDIVLLSDLAKMESDLLNKMIDVFPDPDPHRMSPFEVSLILNEQDRADFYNLLDTSPNIHFGQFIKQLDSGCSEALLEYAKSGNRQWQLRMYAMTLGVLIASLFNLDKQGIREIEKSFHQAERSICECFRGHK